MIIPRKRSLISELHMAVEEFNGLLEDGVLQEIIKNYPAKYFRNSNVPKDKIVLEMSSFSEVPVSLVLYKSRNPWSKALGFVNKNEVGFRIHINTRRLERREDIDENVASLTGSLAHEWGHLFEKFIQKYINPDYFLNHGGNSPENKMGTFQYYLGREVRNHMEDLRNGK